jgi:hypothetical protein
LQSANIHPAAIHEARRLAKLAAGIWLGGWVVILVAAIAFSTGTGETALGAVFGVLIGVIAASIISSLVSLRLAVRALRLDGTSLLAKITIALDCASLLVVLVVGGRILVEFVQ